LKEVTSGEFEVGPYLKIFEVMSPRISQELGKILVGSCPVEQIRLELNHRHKINAHKLIEPILKNLGEHPGQDLLGPGIHTIDHKQVPPQIINHQPYLNRILITGGKQLKRLNGLVGIIALLGEVLEEAREEVVVEGVGGLLGELEQGLLGGQR
jgi:hypothetical protein